MGPFFLGISGLICFWFGGDLFGFHFLLSIVEPSTRGSMLVTSLLTLVVALPCPAVMTAILNPFSERRMALQLF